jgi:hypothetical protein
MLYLLLLTRAAEQGYRRGATALESWPGGCIGGLAEGADVSALFVLAPPLIV